MPQAGDDYSIPTGAETAASDPTVPSDPHGAADVPSFASKLPGYEFLRQIGRGGQAVVYLAIQKSTGRRVAIKVMREGPFSTSDERARFLREVTMLAQFQHPHIVTVYDSGEVDGCGYLVMEYIPGESLDSYLRRRTVSLVQGHSATRSVTETQRDELRQRIELFILIAETVGQAHAAGIAHRDLKPANIRIDPAGQPHVLDFGLAKPWQRAMAGGASDALTQTGQFLGSVPWASPEQVGGNTALMDARTDVYSLGVMLYQFLTEEFPYEVRGAFPRAAREILNTPPRRPSRRIPALGAELEAVILKSLEKSPEQRYADAGAFAADLRRALTGEPILARVETPARRAQRRVRTWVRRHRIASFILACVLATLIAQALAFVPDLWRPLEAAHVRLVNAFAPPAAGAFERLRIVEIVEPPAELNALAAELGLEGVDVVAEPRSRRVIWGKLLERLATAEPRVVVLDMFMRSGARPYDDAFLRGVSAVKDAEGAVVLGVQSWELKDGLPAVPLHILANVGWGRIAFADDPQQWSVPLGLQRGANPVFPGLALAAFCAYQRPAADPAFSLGLEPPHVSITFEEPVPNAGLLRRPVGEPLVVAASQVERIGTPRGDFLTDDLIAHYLIQPPSEHELRDAAWPLRRVFAASPAELRSWCAGKAVLIGDSTSPADMHDRPGGGRVPGWHAHAAGLDSLQRRASLYRVNRLGETSILLLLSAAVALLLVQIARKPVALLSLATAVSLAALAGSVLVFNQARVSCNPFVPLFAFWLSLGFGLTLQRLQRTH